MAMIINLIWSLHACLTEVFCYQIITRDGNGSGLKGDPLILEDSKCVLVDSDQLWCFLTKVGFGFHLFLLYTSQLSFICKTSSSFFGEEEGYM